MVHELVQVFLALLVAMDVVGVAPVHLALTQRLSPPERSRALRASLLTAAGVSVGFALLGKGIFFFLGITVADFQIAGGLILLGLALSKIISLFLAAFGVRLIRQGLAGERGAWR